MHRPNTHSTPQNKNSNTAQHTDQQHPDSQFSKSATSRWNSGHEILPIPELGLFSMRFFVYARRCAWHLSCCCSARPSWLLALARMPTFRELKIEPGMKAGPAVLPSWLPGWGARKAVGAREVSIWNEPGVRLYRYWSTKHSSFFAACSPQHRARAACRASSKLLRQVLHEPRGGFKSCQVGTSPLGYLPEFAALRAQSTPHGPRPGPALALWCTCWFPACPAVESTRKDPGPEEKEVPKCEIKQYSGNYSNKFIK